MENPFFIFETWFEEAKHQSGVDEPNALSLATSDGSGRVSNRMVLLKGHSEKGFEFFTHFTSRKGEQISKSPYGAMCFYWEKTGKQIRIEGKIERLSEEKSDLYFKSRPLKSRIGAWVSIQSQPLQSYSELLKEIAVFSVKSGLNPDERPKTWGGYILIPDRMEFWKKGDFRVHERVLFQKDNKDSWERSFLYP